MVAEVGFDASTRCLAPALRSRYSLSERRRAGTPL
jgi:hypothetical protein